LIMDLLESPNGTLYGVLIAFLIVILTTGLFFAFFPWHGQIFILEKYLISEIFFRVYDDVFVGDREKEREKNIVRKM